MSEKSFSLELQSDLKELERLESFINEVAQAGNAGDETSGYMMLLLSEAVTNGIIHGNKLDPAKKVFVEAIVHPDKIVLKVEDQGDGFNPEAVPNPLEEENLLKTGGRGVYLMKEYADDVTYNDKGNQIRLTFTL